MLQHGALWCNMVQAGASWCNMVQLGATYCNVVQRGATWCNMVQHGATWCSMVQDGAKSGCKLVMEFDSYSYDGVSAGIRVIHTEVPNLDVCSIYQHSHHHKSNCQIPSPACTQIWDQHHQRNPHHQRRPNANTKNHTTTQNSTT